MIDPIFILGEPPTFNIPPPPHEIEWKKKIAQVCPHPLTYPHLRFVVSSWKRKGHYFDLDNLCKPVLDVIGSSAESLWAVVELGEKPGVEISEGRPAVPLDVHMKFYIPHPPKTSKKLNAPLPELANYNVIGTDGPLGIMLLFDSVDASVNTIGFGPVKAALDALSPIVGTHNKQVADHRIHELRVLKEGQTEIEGLTIGVRIL